MYNKIVSKVTEDHLLVISTGAIHARKETFTIDNQLFNPLGSRLNKNYKIYSVFLKPSSGYVYNYGKKDVTLLSSVQEKREKDREYYNLVWDIGEAEPVTPQLNP